MIDKAWWREEIHASIAVFGERRAEKRRKAINAISVNEIRAALNYLRALNFLKGGYAADHGRTIKKARWKKWD